MKKPIGGHLIDGDLLKDVKHALQGSGPKYRAIRIRGEQSDDSGPQPCDLYFLPDGRFVQYIRGSIPETTGFDGRHVWKLDSSGFVQTLDFGDLDLEMALGFLTTGYWASLTAPVDLKESAGGIEMTMKESGQIVDMHIDPTTHLPSEADFRTGDRRITLGDWKAAGDRMVPMHVELKSDDDSRLFTGSEVEACGPNEVESAIPRSKVSDTTVDPNKPAAIECKFAGKSHIALHPLVNGQDIGWFILDSGSGAMIIDKEVADSLQLEKISRGTGTGVGGTVESFGRAVGTFQLGPVTVKNLTLGDYDMTQIGGKAKPFTGCVGTPFLRRVVLKLDWRGPSVEAYDRATYKLPAGTWQPLRFDSDNPAILAQVSGTPKAWYRVDSGGAGFLSLHAPFVDQWKLLENRATVDSKATGVGGTSSSKTGTMDWFEVAGKRFENPKVEFSTAKHGTFADPYLAGNIGIDTLRNFTVIFDFAGSRVALIPHE